jgi:hypothetical protein
MSQFFLDIHVSNYLYTKNVSRYMCKASGMIINFGWREYYYYVKLCCLLPEVSFHWLCI